MNFFRESDLEVKQVLEGITLKSVAGEHTMMTFFTFGPGSVIPSHKHPHEQITYVIEGEIEFTLESETRILKAGDGIVITADQEHSAKILAHPAKAIDAWYPIREDYT